MASNILDQWNEIKTLVEFSLFNAQKIKGKA